MPGSTESKGLGRRKFRKGTRSCFECRRRKQRCVFKSVSDIVCSGCHIRGASCVEQGEVQVDKASLDRRENLRERVARLESMLYEGEPQAEIIPDQSSLDGMVSDDMPLAVDDAPIDKSDASISAPVLSLFGNAVLTSDGRQENSGPDTSGPHVDSFNASALPIEADTSKLAFVHRTLADVVPNDRELSIIVNAGGGWWRSWRLMYPGICSDDSDITLQDYILQAMGQKNPTVMGNALLCLALSLQHLPWDFDYSSLGTKNGGKAAIQKYVSAVDCSVFCDDNLLSSLEGLEAILLQSKLYINSGQARKAWLLIRRGFSYAELVGLTDNARLSRNVHSGSKIRRESIQSHLIEVDRQLSLILGLPTMAIKPISESRIGLEPMSNVQYRRRLFHIAGSIIERNLHHAKPSLITVVEQNHALDDLAELKSDKWWDISSLMLHTSDMGDICDRLFTQFWHHQIKCALHLPFMLRSATKPRYQSHRVECFTSSREMLHIFHILRSSDCTRFIHYCQVMDFQAFTAAVILVLGLLGYQSFSQAEDQAKGSKDWDLIDLTIEALRNASMEPQNSVARQSLQALETMREARNVPLSNPDQQANTIKIVVPYFGTISVAAGEKYKRKGTDSTVTPSKDFNGEQGFPQADWILAPTGIDHESLISFDSFMPYAINDYSIPLDSFPHLHESPWPTLGYTDLDQEWYGL